jgi:hypothetical protein
VSYRECHTTVSATAKILKNLIRIEVGQAVWIARPIPSGQGHIMRAISTLFSTHYHVYDSEKEDKPPVASVYYYPVRDEILVQVEEQKWRTKSNTFGPTLFVYEDIEYALHEKITGRFFIVEGERLVAEGRCQFRSVIMESYDKKMETFLGYLSIGLLIRTLSGELGV